MTQTPDETGKGTEKPDWHWAEIRQPDLEVLVQGTKHQVANTVAKLVPASAGNFPQRSPETQAINPEREPVAVTQHGESMPQTPQPIRTESVPPPPRGNATQRVAMPPTGRERFLNTQERSDLGKTALTATAIGIAPAYALASGAFSAAASLTPAAAATLIAAPTIGYFMGKEEKKTVERTTQGVIAGSGIYWLSGGSMAKLMTLGTSLGIPALGSYIGYKIGKRSKNGARGAAIGGLAGMAAAPAVAASVTGQSATWGTLLGLGTTGLYAGIVGAGGAGLYLAGKGYQRLTGKENEGIGRTLAQGTYLPIELLKRGVVGGVKRMRRKQPNPAASAV